MKLYRVITRFMADCRDGRKALLLSVSGAAAALLTAVAAASRCLSSRRNARRVQDLSASSDSSPAERADDVAPLPEAPTVDLPTDATSSPAAASDAGHSASNLAAHFMKGSPKPVHVMAMSFDDDRLCRSSLRRSSLVPNPIPPPLELTSLLGSLLADEDLNNPSSPAILRSTSFSSPSSPSFPSRLPGSDNASNLPINQPSSPSTSSPREPLHNLMMTQLPPHLNVFFTRSPPSSPRSTAPEAAAQAATTSDLFISGMECGWSRERGQLLVSSCLAEGSKLFDESRTCRSSARGVSDCGSSSSSATQCRIRALSECGSNTSTSTNISSSSLEANYRTSTSGSTPSSPNGVAVGNSPRNKNSIGCKNTIIGQTNAISVNDRCSNTRKSSSDCGRNKAANVSSSARRAHSRAKRVYVHMRMEVVRCSFVLPLTAAERGSLLAACAGDAAARCETAQRHIPSWRACHEGLFQELLGWESGQEEVGPSEREGGFERRVLGWHVEWCDWVTDGHGNGEKEAEGLRFVVYRPRV